MNEICMTVAVWSALGVAASMCAGFLTLGFFSWREGDWPGFFVGTTLACATVVGTAFLANAALPRMFPGPEPIWVVEVEPEVTPADKVIDKLIDLIPERGEE